MSLPVVQPAEEGTEFRFDGCVLSLIPPMTQLNTPYPSTAYLTGFLRSRKVRAVQADLAHGLVLSVLSQQGLHSVRSEASETTNVRAGKSPSVRNFLKQFDRYESTIDRVIRFLQGTDPTLAHRIVTRTFLPEGPRFEALDRFEADPETGDDPLLWAFGVLGVQDKARHFCTLYLSDLADVIRDAVDERFEFVRYAESLAQSQPTFEPLHQALTAPPTSLDRTLEQLTLDAIRKHEPDVVLITVPFPGTVYAAFRIAQTIRKHHPNVRIALGGGYANTELRQLKEPRVFDYFHFVMLDDGERPILAMLEHLSGRRPEEQLVRTYHRCADSGAVIYRNHAEPDVPFSQVGTPNWDGLDVGAYLSTLDLLNPMHRLWSDGRWNKLTIAHGCYWKKCSFCDISLDYISRYDTAAASLLADRITEIVDQTGQTGFHFVDEAAPPKGLESLAQELLRRRIQISWWGNIRFEKTFTPELCQLLAESGCIAVSGGLEVASDRLLKLMKKGVSVAQVARVTRAFADNGILVHAYLMYGFPTQTLQDTVDSLEYVRQLFENGCIHSGFFHRFTCTVHSPVGLAPQDYGVTLKPLPEITFASNDVEFVDPTGVDHDKLGRALSKGIYNFMHGIGIDADVREWFEGKVPRTTVSPRFISNALRGRE
ncbi:MAG: radical SAM protein [Planctomycetaceae bacterium]|nr:radical SAM protein [Planctomycetaceae bacterium]